MRIIVFTLTSLIIISCGQNNEASVVAKGFADTIVNRKTNQVIVQYHSSASDSLFIKKSTTTLLRDSLTEKEKILLRGGGFSDLNYAESVDGSDSVLVKDYVLQGNLLIVKVYFTRGPGAFYLGKAKLGKEGELILGYGDKIALDGYGFPIPYYSMELTINIPDTEKIERIYFVSRNFD